MLGLDHFSPERLTKLRDDLLKNNSPAKVRELDDNPADYLYPYIQQSARAAATVCAKHVHISSKSRNGAVVPVDWEQNQENRRALISSRNSLSRFVQHFEKTHGIQLQRFEALLVDYEALVLETQVIGPNLQGLLQQQANSAIMEETKRGLIQGDAIRR